MLSVVLLGRANTGLIKPTEVKDDDSIEDLIEENDLNINNGETLQATHMVINEISDEDVNIELESSERDEEEHNESHSSAGASKVPHHSWSAVAEFATGATGDSTSARDEKGSNDSREEKNGEDGAHTAPGSPQHPIDCNFERSLREWNPRKEVMLYTRRRLLIVCRS